MKVVNKKNPKYSYNRFNIPYWDMHRRRYYPWIYPGYEPIYPDFVPLYPDMIEQQIINSGAMSDVSQSVVQTLFGKLPTVPVPHTAPNVVPPAPLPVKPTV